jgi:hypothetical protein
MLKYNNFNEAKKYKKAGNDRKYGCLMIYFDDTDWMKKIKDIVKEEDLYLPKGEEDDYGYCKYPHTTVLYGFHNYKDIEKDLKEYVIPLKDLDDIIISDITIFENDGFDVVKYEVESKKLHKLNKTLEENFDYTTDFPKYIPHMTIAYVKEGKGKDYVKKLKEQHLKPTKYVYSDDKHKKTTIKANED